MICAAERIPPNSEYLLLDPQPAIKIPKTQTEVTEVKYKIPTFRSRTIRVLPKGMQTKAITGGTTTKNGASHQLSLSTPDGTIFSFKRSLTMSAAVCNVPCQPTTMGPKRF